MKNIVQKIFSGLATPIKISLAVLLLSTPAVANENSQITGGLIPREPNFFKQGRDLFDREIYRLLTTNRQTQEAVLKIPHQLSIQEQLFPLEKPQPLPSNYNSPKTNK
ncbi:conserved hypothetical protein [Trichormus variabilis ATCC 29413]|uniref:Uncharacterized protein n=2 Tax=Anabaena variabilis TaxID=264691 RepID=Q3MA55_TRIV2|nr:MULTISPECIES: hypothetical protein [Nostocaceae]ABA22131.1 conserved hypothetical protein [Trichormus variabilis ATCC 29413]MBC1216278.1 hypothetical protein [Trichormus variabilis ARAD]MBC1256326.1 hypothetical protein [Trichormus variabilis V5]MBC1269596.1 hypothetical protein [Trichormus variabilis FSR]MBC1302428.1 hypothetical protein [Trichormus variabilis N2B]